MDTIIRMIAKDAPIKAMVIQAKGIVERHPPGASHRLP